MTILNAIPPGRVLALGTVWAGSLKPLVDGTIGALEPLVTGFTSGRVLHAEGPPTDALDLGRIWAGRLSSQLLDNALPSGSSEELDAVDLTELYREVASFREAIGGTPALFTRAADSLRRVKAAAGAIDACVRGARATSDGRHPMLSRNRHLTFGSSSTRDTSLLPAPAAVLQDIAARRAVGEEMNRLAREHWDRHDASIRVR